MTVDDSLWLEREKTLYCCEAPGRGGLLIMPQLDFLDDNYPGHVPMYGCDWADLEQ